jgi:hypothetical protein
MGDPSLVGPRTHLHTHWRASVGHRHTRRAYARICLMGDPSQTAAPAAFRLGSALKARYLQVFKANAILARHPCQTAAAHLPCTRPPDDWGLFRQNPPALASPTDLAGPHAATQGLICARLCLMGDPSQRAALGNNNRMSGSQMSCRQQPAPPPRDATKMSPRIRIGPESVMVAHAPSPPAAGSHCPAREDFSSPLRNRIFSNPKPSIIKFIFTNYNLFLI